MHTLDVYVGTCDPDCDGWTTSIWRVAVPHISGLEPTSDAALRTALERIPVSRPPADEAFALSQRDVERFTLTATPYGGSRGSRGEAEWYSWDDSVDDGLPIAHVTLWGTP